MQLLLLLATWLSTVCATPTLGYPINSQVPPVARVGKAFSYVFPANTFGNYRPDVVFQITGQPAWLNIDAATRTLYGTPATGDIGAPKFNLVAADSTGSAIDTVVLIVSALPGPYIALPLSTQLRTMGRVDGRGGLVLEPNQQFKIAFASGTFAEAGGNVSAYYGTSDNHTPLPSWISFDPSTIAFSGKTPPVLSAIAPPQYFEFVLVGTDFPGFAGISATFNIVVGAHSLSFDTPMYTQNATFSSPFSFKIPTGSLKLDGVAAAAANISSITANTTGTWLSFDPQTLTLSGTPGATSESLTIAITANDVFGSVAVTAVRVVVSSTSVSIFSGSLPTSINATGGSFFSYTFDSSVVPTAASLTVTVSGATWLMYNPENRTLYGQVPASLLTKRQATTVNVNIEAALNGETATRDIGINVVSGNIVASSSTPVTSSATASAPSTLSRSTTTASRTTSSSSAAVSARASNSAAAATGSSNSSKLGGGAIAGIVIGVLAALALGLMLFWCCCLRKRRGRNGSQRSASPSDISRPMEKTEDWPMRNADDPAQYDAPRQLGTFDIFKSTSDGRLSGYVAEINTHHELAPPLAHELPPLPDSPSLAPVASAYASSEPRSTSGTYTASRSSAAPSSAAASGRNNQRALSDITTSTNVPSRNPRTGSILKNTLGRLSVFGSENTPNRDSTNTLDTVATDELFSVRLVGDTSQASSQSYPMAPPLARTALPRRMLTSATANSGQTIGSYTSSEGDYIQRFGSNQESLSSGQRSQQNMAAGRQDSSQAQPWRVLQHGNSYGSFNSYATTDSNLSDEFSFDDSLHVAAGNASQVFNTSGQEEAERDARAVLSPSQRVLAVRPDSNGQLLDAPFSPQWGNGGTPILGAEVTRRPTLTERVLSSSKNASLQLQDPRKRPMSSDVESSNDLSGETSGEIAFI
ncbi:hypothetical protein BCR37DRAFT_386962 [Protomyces lactucae-debilis]|uniref:Dystroglycan-type cadherin-like domain-containing protein n=1 Tax=Protomyces lactucae-debilis TaxID=2754530 RepID=A0A1Y2FGL1_PROLT|nr:uncharacterized protein BCR37DRAFT_386962 [Protomyces lactucae-debilis]ORY83080.1 hypothetical protein BCR37DRAFT_386962 [Protomyces lactucae-debilis]